MKFLTVAIQLPSDEDAAAKIIEALPLFGDFHGGTVIASYSGNAISENELFEDRFGFSAASEVRRTVARLAEKEKAESMLKQLPPEMRTEETLKTLMPRYPND